MFTVLYRALAGAPQCIAQFIDDRPRAAWRIECVKPRVAKPAGLAHMVWALSPECVPVSLVRIARAGGVRAARRP
ncbi:hypothetical protein [Burkholderia sp. TSV86]|uniref:hypothetical protein n=1 Tax=Burkholderia sp. TSV86 TaxID=1385594 RepID=UPI0007572F9D|nr:hypothetical protein [Burkholderia sp. TSV86]KVE35928.1 hypothetical protein WS68_05595 [Burkholderia sp. TSV86]